MSINHYDIKSNKSKDLQKYIDVYQKAQETTNEILAMKENKYEINCATKTLSIWLEYVLYDIKWVKRTLENSEKLKHNPPEIS